MKIHRTILGTVMMLAGVIAPVSAQGQVNVQTDFRGLTYTSMYYSGWSRFKYDIVFVGDGFTEDEQQRFNNKADECLAWLRFKVPFSLHMCAMNVWRVNVVSNESGIDYPADPNGPIERDTELDCTYGGADDNGDGTADTPVRLIRTLSPHKVTEAASHAPDADMVVVLVNDDTHLGGSAGHGSGRVITWIGGHPANAGNFYFAKTLIHELGHAFGGLADEYDCYFCNADSCANPQTPGWPTYPACGSGTVYCGQDEVPCRAEPLEPNVTSNPDLHLTTDKWADLIAPGTSIPTTLDDGAFTVGLWEGGKYYPSGIYRAQSSCRMNRYGNDFCAVCYRVLEQKLEPYCGPCELPFLNTEYVGFLCRFGDLLQELRVPLRAQVRYKLMINARDTSDDSSEMARLGDDDALYLLEGAPDDFAMRILDDLGNVVAVGERYGGGILAAGYTIDRARQYHVEILSGKNPYGRELTLRSRLYVNERETILPDADG